MSKEMKLEIDGVKYTAKYRDITLEDRIRFGPHMITRIDVDYEFEMIKTIIEHHKSKQR